MTNRAHGELDTLDDDARTTLEIMMPAGLKRALVQKGKEEGKSASVLVRDWAAEKVDYTISDTYAINGVIKLNETEKKLMALVRSGKIDLEALARGEVVVLK